MPRPTRTTFAGLLAMAVLVAGCGHDTPIGASAKTPVPSPSSVADVGRLLVLALGETRYVSAEDYVAPAARVTVTQASLKASWEALAHQDGKFRSVGDPTTGPTGADGTDIDVPVTFAGGTEVIHVTVDATLHVSGVAIPPGSGHNPALEPSAGSSASTSAAPSST